MAETLYLECASGISGDMTVAALLDLGADPQKLRAALESLQLEGVRFAIRETASYGLRACSFDVLLPEDAEPDHPHDHGAHPDHKAHEHHHHHHEHRNLAEVCAVIDRGRLTPRASSLAKKIFRIVAEAESKAHGVPVEAVHFHEVGALDSIADIVAAAVCLDDLNITECIIPRIAEGTGSVACQHGELPVPVPAVVNVAAAYQLPLAVQTEIRGEMVTPTGAAIAAALRTGGKLPETFTVKKTGLGAGKRDFGRPNVLRAMLVEAVATPAPAAAAPEAVMVLETNLDDATGEELGLAMEQLFAAGARDVHYTPCFMKKNRPGWLLRVIADAAKIPALESVIFRTTPAIGTRRYPVARTCLQREIRNVRLPVGEVAVKFCTASDGCRFAYPEYESVRALSAASGIPFGTLFQAAQRAAEEEWQA